MLDSRIEVDDSNYVVNTEATIIHELQQQIEDLKKNQKNSSGRKSQVLSLLQEFDSISILEISNKLRISTKNVSSQLTYLRSDGFQIFTDPNGRKVLMNQ